MSWQSRRTDRKRRRFFVELLEDRWLLAGDISQVGYFDTWDGGIIRSTDIAGITSHPSGHLYLADSEINELPLIFNGDNVFETSLSGDQVYRGRASGNTEPTGITFNEFDGYFYVTNDTGGKFVTRYDSNLNKPLYEFAPQDDMPGAVDPEGITSDPSTGFLYVADGNAGDRQVLIYSLDLSNPNEATRDVIFQGAFSVADQMGDAEGIAFHEPSGHLFLIDGTQDLIFEYTTSGILVDEYDISRFSPRPSTPQGLTFGPTSSTSDDPSALSLYIADGGSDNFPDGGVYEAVIDTVLANPLIDIRVVGDVPYSQGDYGPLEADLANVGPSDEFFVHLGDIQSQGSCVASTYSDVASSLRSSSIPVFIIPGDNEYNDCPDPNQAWTYWDANLMRLEEHWSPGFTVLRQSVRPENFAFVHSGVLFIGINLVGGTVHDSNEWTQRMTDNAEWVNESFNNFGSQVTSALVFGHAFPDPTGGDRQQFGQAFVTAAQDFSKPVLYMMGDEHSWVMDNPFSGAPNVTRVIVDQGVPSVRVTISDHPKVPFSFASPDVSPTTSPSPVLAAIGAKSVDEGSPLTFTAWATDRELPADNLSFSLDSGAPAGATIDPTTGEFSWTPGEAQGPAVYSVTVRVTDDGAPNLEDFETINITVSEVNQPPVLTAIGNKSVGEGSPLTFTVSATNPDLPTNNLSFSLDSGAPAGATIDPTTGEFNWTPGEAEGPAVYSVTVRVTDDGTPSLDDFETINITVVEVNQAPVLAAIGNKSVEEGSLLTFTASAADPDLPASNFSFSLDSDAPAGATIDPATGEFNWTPDEPQGPAVYSVTVRVTDDGVPSRDAFETINITVREVNQAPVLAAIGNKIVDEGSLLTFTASATDANLPLHNLSFSLDSDAPAGATINATTGEFLWTPPGGTSPGNHTVTIRVSDDGAPSLEDFETITITVNDVNLPPVLAGIGAQSVEEGSPLTFTASVIDPDLPADNLSFSLDAGAPAGATINPTTGEFTWTPDEAQGPAVHSVTVRVTDDGVPSLDHFETINITVREVNQAPVLAAIGDKSVEEGSPLTFTASATDVNLPLNNLSFSLDSGAPAGATIDPSTGQFSWTPPGGTSLGNQTVTVRVTDDGVPSMEDFETITITVNDVDLPPVLAMIGAKTIEEGSLLAFTASATDLDQPADNFSFSLDSGAPAGATIDPTTGEFNWTPDEAEGPAVYSVTVRVTQDGTPTLHDFETISITVGEVNQAPVLAAIGDRSIEEGSLLTFTASATDADLPANNQLSFSLDSGAPAGATINATTGEFRWMPTEADGPAVYSVTVRVTDDGVTSLDDFETFDITVGEVGQAPKLAAIGNWSVDEGSLLTFAVSATDADLPANNLSFSLDSGAPQGATIDPITGQFSWTPPGGTSPGIHTVTIRVTDDGVPSLDDFETITITVNDVNLSPVLEAIGAQSVEEGSTLTFIALATDPDLPADHLSFTLDSDAPTGATINSTTGEFNWTPSEAEGPAVYSVTVRVTDDGVSSLDDFETFDITVSEVNQAPELAVIGNQSIDEGSLLTFTASATDADLPLQNLSFSLDAGAPQGATIHPNTGQFSWTPPGGTSLGDHTVTIRVSDDSLQGLDDFETITITVNDVNLPPVLAAISNKVVEEGGLLTFTAQAIDLDQPAANFSFSLDSGAPAGATIDATTGEFNWAPGETEGPAVYSVTVRVTEDGAPTLDDFQTINITVSEVNQAPVLAAIGDQSVDEGSLLTFTASATDADLPANNLSFSLDSGAPAGATIDATTGEFSWTPTEAQGPAVHSVTVRVTDDGTPSLDDFETINITVGEVNQAPELAAIGNRSVDEGSPLTFTASAIDPDLPASNFSFSLDSDAPAGATIDPSTGQFSWTPPGGTSPGIHTVTVRVSEDGEPSLEDFETITITVNDVNLAPVLAVIGGQSVEEGSPLTFTVSATDLDQPADQLSFSLDSGAPAGATIDPTTGEFNWTPGEAEGPAVHSVTVRVTDDGTPSQDHFETINITVGEVNQAPELAAIGDMQVDEGSPLIFTASATDADVPANNLSFSLDAGAPLDAIIDSSTGQFSWTPPGGTSPGNHTVTIRVSDDGLPNLEDFETITITVNDVNLPPVLTAIGSQSVEEGSPLTFTASATDPDLPADQLSFSLDPGAAAGATINPNTGEFSWTPPELELSAVYSVTVRVTDDGTPSLEDFETINLTVREANQPPVLAAIGNKSIDEGSLLTFTASATDTDLPANNLSYSLDSGAPAGATIDSNTGEFRWTPAEAQGPAVHSVTVRVTDDGLLSLDDFETFEITVGEVNQAPELAVIGNRSVDEGSLLSFTASATDPDLSASNLSFSLDTGAPLGATIDPSTGQFSWMPPGGTSPGNHTVTIRVSDDGLPSLDDFETITITVNDVNLPPVLAAIDAQSVDEGSLLTFTASAIDPDLPANNFFFSLDSDAPLGATIDPSTGQFSWTPPGGTSLGDHTVTVRVTDDGLPSLDDFVTFTITVTDVNLPPVLAVIGGQSVEEGSLLTFTASATDLDQPADNFSFSLDSDAPAGATINPITGEFSWTPGEAEGPAVYPVTVRVTEDGTPTLHDFETINITVVEVNQAPELAAIGDKSLDEGSLLTFTATATDADFPANNLSFSLDSDAPAGATIDPTTGQFSWTPAETQGPAVHSVTVRVTDDGTPGLDDFETINITVGEINQAPELATIGNRSVDEGSLLTFTASATDADFPANNLSFSLDSGAPAGATIDSITGEFNWTPDFLEHPAVYSVTVRVTDDGTPALDDFQTFDITVREVNQAPVLATIGNTSIDEGSLLTFTASASDSDLPANNLFFSLDSGAPAGATIDPSTGEFRWTPTETQGPAVHSVTVRVTDDGTPTLDDFQTFDITVGEVNQAPALAAIGNRSVDEGSLLSFTVSTIDADFPANNLAFSLDASAPLGATIDPSTGQFSWTPPGGTSPGIHTVTVRVTDDGLPSLDDFETFTVTVNDVNLPPVLASIGGQSVEERSVITFTASATDADLPANNLSFSLDSDAPAGATIDATTGEFNWTPPELDGPAVFSVTVRVTDDETPSLDDFETINIMVLEVNQPPVLAAIGNKSVDEGSLLTFAALATDADLPVNNLTFSLDAGAPAGSTIDPSTGQFSWTPPGGTSPGNHTVTIRVTDDGVPILDDFETITITVNDVNLPPVLSAIGTHSVVEGSPLTFTASATDPDLPADNLSFSLDANAPLSATIDPSTGEFSWTPGEAYGSAVFSITVRVTDDGTPSLDDRETFNITVREFSQAPILAAIGNKRINEGNLLTFTASAIDPDFPAKKLSFSLDSGAPAGATINATTGEFNWMPAESQGPAVYSVTVRVTKDGAPSLEDFETFQVTVREANRPPVLAAIGNKSVDEGSLLTFSASATDPDLPANELSFSLDSGAAAGATIDSITGEFRWTPTEAEGPAVHSVTVRVTDDDVSTLDDFETIDIAVGEVNQAPVLAAIGNQSIDEGSLLTFTASATDSDLPVSNLSFSLDSDAPLGATIDPSTGQFSWTPPVGTSPGNHTVTVRVSEDGVPSLDDFETINIMVIPLPPRDPLDVNHDGRVTVLDALAIINQLSRMLTSDNERVVGSVDQALSDYDANGDGKVSALDALLVINHISITNQEAESMLDGVIPSRAPVTPAPESWLDDDLIRLLADDNIIAGLGKHSPSGSIKASFKPW